MSLYFIKAGLQTSLQDGGRYGQRHLGISQSGAMDANSMRMANWLLNKPLDSPVLEIAIVGPTIRFDHALTIAVCGAQFELHLNSKRVYNNQVIHVELGDCLIFSSLQQGARAYLAFTGELDISPMLASYSTHLTACFGGFKNRAFKNRDYLKIIGNDDSNKIDQCALPQRTLPDECFMPYPGNYLMRCTESVESSKFTKRQKTLFFSQAYKVSADLNRMGIQLHAKTLEFDQPMVISSSGLTQGSIQIPPSGQPIISCVDGQTIGGYPRIANIISADLPRLGQLKSGDKINFIMISRDYALQILAATNHWYDELLK